MRIGIVTTWFERGAAYVSRQYRDILEKQHEVFIYARGGESYAVGDPVWDDRRVTWGKNPHIPMPHAIDLDHFQNWVTGKSLDVVFFNEQQWWEPVLLANRLGVKTGAYVDYYTEETIPLFGCYDFLICNTRRHYSVFDWHPQAYHVPWGTDVTLFSPQSLDPVQPGAVTFFHSAGISPERKGTDLVIKAFSAVKGPTRLVLHAQQNLKQLLPNLQEQITEMETAGRLVCYEQTVPAPGLYHLGDVYVYPSRLDGIGLTLPEALACGLPVITSDNPPMNEFVDGTNGRVIRITRLFSRADGYYWPQCIIDLEELRDNMQHYIDEMGQLETFKQKAREYAEKNLNWTENAAKLPVLFEQAKRSPASVKVQAEELALLYEEKRISLQQRIKRVSPILFNVTRTCWQVGKKLGLLPKF